MRYSALCYGSGFALNNFASCKLVKCSECAEGRSGQAMLLDRLGLLNAFATYDIFSSIWISEDINLI